MRASKDDAIHDRPGDVIPSARELAALPVAVLWLDDDGSIEGRDGRASELACATHWIDEVDEGDRERARDAWDAAREAGSELRCELRLIAADGSRPWHLVQIAARPTLPRRWVLTATDIDARRSVEDQLIDSEADLRLIVERTPTPLIVFDHDGEVHHVSRGWRDLTGYDPSSPELVSVLGRRILHLEDDGTLENLRALWYESLERPVELDLWDADDRHRTVLLESARLGRNAAGRRLCVAALVDISARKQAQEALEEADRQKNVFLAELGHELRNPLAVVRSAIGLLESMEPAEPRLGRAREILHRQTAHITRLVDGLLDISRIVSGKLELQTEIVDLASVVADVLRDRAGQIANRGLSLDSAQPVEALWVDGDRSRLVQVFDNLLSNAIKFTASGGRIDARIDVEADSIVVQIADTGIGVAPDFLPFVFEPFRQGIHGRSRRAGGLGLGLALVRGVVALHGGSVEVASDGPDAGTTFTVRLPRAQPGASDDAPSVRRVDARRILLIDDNRDHAELLAELLRDFDHEVSIAYDGEEGLEAARSSLPEVILCDLGLPGDVSGLDVARELRADPGHAGVALIAVTGFARAEDRQASHAAGFDAHLVKPVDVTAIQAALLDLER